MRALDPPDDVDGGDFTDGRQCPMWCISALAMADILELARRLQAATISGRVLGVQLACLI